MSNAGGMSTVTRYTDMLAGNATWNLWEPAGAYESIAVATVPSGGVASITFSSIPQNYTHLQVRVLGRTNRALFRDFIGINFNSDTGNNYAYHQIDGNGTSAAASGVSSVNEINTGYLGSANASNANAFGVIIIDILDYTNTTKNTTTRALGGFDDNGQGQIIFSSGLWINTNAVNSILITPGVGTLFSQFSSFALYGIKG